MPLFVRLAGAAALGALCAPVGAAQHPPVAPATWAITGARIEPLAGPAIASGTVVIRDGLIAAVGAAVAAPADARLIDGSGLTVYPGFIDAYGSLGMPSPASGGGQGGGGQAATQRGAANSTFAAGMQAERRAVELLEPGANTFAAARGAGFTAALTAQPAGIFRGSSALIALRDDAVPVLVIRDGVAQHIGFSRGGGGGYPGSLMGVFAQLRQQLLDAQHYRDRTAAYARNPRGMTRPAHDPTLEALLPVLAGRQPVVMWANSEREILRARDLAAEFQLDAIIAGGAEAWRAAAALRAAGMPVVLDIDFPRRTAPTGGRGATRADETPEDLGVLRARVEQPKGAGRLASAGVPLAIHSGGDYADFLANLRRAVEAGLDPDRALRALTIDAATLFGVADRLGTIEAGKIANLTIVSGDLFAEGSRVSRLFIDGEHIEIPTPAAVGPRSAARGQDAEPAGDRADDHDHPRH